MKKKTNKLIGLSVKNIVGVGLIGATSGMVNSLEEGTTKNFAKIVPGIQSLNLVSENFKSLKFKKIKK